jgi:PPOX class probable F420-dependent enzyme
MMPITTRRPLFAAEPDCGCQGCGCQGCGCQGCGCHGLDCQLGGGCCQLGGGCCQLGAGGGPDCDHDGGHDEGNDVGNDGGCGAGTCGTCAHGFDAGSLGDSRSSFMAYGPPMLTECLVSGSSTPNQRWLRPEQPNHCAAPRRESLRGTAPGIIARHRAGNEQQKVNLMAIDPAHEALLIERDLGVLATLKRDGRPQLSSINFHYDPAASVVRISVIAGRAKVLNARRDPRVSLHVATADGWNWVVAEGTAELTPVAADRHDATVEELVKLYRDIRAEHPDWDDYRRAMVDDKRLVLRLHIERTYASR